MVAICVLLSTVDGVGAVGVPVKFGDASGAAANIVIVCATVKSTGCALPEVLFPLRVLAFICAKYVLVTPLLFKPIVPVVVIVPPDNGFCAVIDVTVPELAFRLAIYCAVARYDVPL